MNKRCLFSMAVLVVALTMVFPSAVAAQGFSGGGAALSPSSELLVASSSDNGASKATMLRERGVPGKGIDDTPGLKKLVNAVSRAMERVRNMFRERERIAEVVSDNITVSDNTTTTKAEILKERGITANGLDTAPGLQKPFNPNSNAARHGNEPVVGNTTTISDNSTTSKAEILKERGVPGNGLGTAPGLQKPFNPKSNAANKAGKDK